MMTDSSLNRNMGIKGASLMTTYLSDSTMHHVANNSEVTKVIADSSSGASIASIAYVGDVSPKTFQKLPIGFTVRIVTDGGIITHPTTTYYEKTPYGWKQTVSIIHAK